MRNCDNVSAAITNQIKTVRAILLHCARARIERRSVIANYADLIDYLMLDSSSSMVERVRVLFLDNRHRLIRDEEMFVGTIDATDLHPREILRRALELGASGIVLAHNHPSGDVSPSAADRRMTSELKHACIALRLTLHDHLIVGATGYASFRGLGIL